MTAPELARRQAGAALVEALDVLSEALPRAVALAREEERAAERAAVVAWLRGEPERLVACDGHRHADGKPCFVLSPMPSYELAEAIERSEHRREEE